MRHVSPTIPSTEPTAVFQAVPERSALLIRVRSNVGPIDFGATGLEGTVEVAVLGSHVVASERIAARFELRVDTLTSGNPLYDAELLRRIDARRFPVAAVELDGAESLGADRRFRVDGPVTFHGVTRTLSGVVAVVTASPERIVVRGEEAVDIRDFDVASPTMLMLKIYPDVRVHLQLEATRVE